MRQRHVAVTRTTLPIMFNNKILLIRSNLCLIERIIRPMRLPMRLANVCILLECIWEKIRRKGIGERNKNGNPQQCETTGWIDPRCKGQEHVLQSNSRVSIAHWRCTYEWYWSQVFIACITYFPFSCTGKVEFGAIKTWD